jgi:hypothetical protein
LHRTFHGSGKYDGINRAMALQPLSDSESCFAISDADPSHGSFKEPLSKSIGQMRALDFSSSVEATYVHFATKINSKMNDSIFFVKFGITNSLAAL